VQKLRLQGGSFSPIMTRMRTTHRQLKRYVTPHWSDSDLRASLQAVGATKPHYLLAGSTVDGTRRARLCTALGIPILSVTLPDRRAADRVLWIEHPERLIARTANMALSELSTYLGASIPTLAAARAELLTRQAPPRRKARMRYQSRIAKLHTYLGLVEQGLEPLQLARVQAIIDPERAA